MSDAIVQKGQAMIVGFGGLVYAGYLPEDGLEIMGTQYEDEQEVPDENDAAISVLLSTPHVPFKASFLIKGTGSITPPTHGQAVTLTHPTAGSVTYFCRGGSAVRLNRAASQLTLDLVKYPDIVHA
jgi:hypothetical protein